ncbi:MAG: FAD-binding oxidoreductase [Salinivirgaceae bacterium]
MSSLNQVLITENQPIGSQAFLLKFKRTFTFKPGQIIGITTQKDIAPRLYSICSGSDDSTISILYTVKEDGVITPKLSELKISDTIWITEPQGKFTNKGEPAWWIATGTGIAPFYSMMQSGQKPLKLIHGGRTIADLYFHQQFKAFSDYIKCCSQDSGEGIFAGRLTSYLDGFDTLPQNLNYYLCGSAEMVVDVRNLLIKKGVEYHQIITEIYF